MKRFILGLAVLLVLLAPGAASAAGLEFRLVLDCMPGDTVLPYQVQGIALNMCVEDAPFLTASDITAASDITSQIPNREMTGISNLRALQITLTPAGAARLTSVTREHPDEEIAILMDGQALSVMEISETIRTATVAIQFPMDDAGYTALLKQFGGKS